MFVGSSEGRGGDGGMRDSTSLLSSSLSTTHQNVCRCPAPRVPRYDRARYRPSHFCGRLERLESLWRRHLPQGRVVQGGRSDEQRDLVATARTFLLCDCGGSEANRGCGSTARSTACRSSSSSLLRRGLSQRTASSLRLTNLAPSVRSSPPPLENEPDGETGLSGITWSGFDNHFFLFTYEDTRDLFAIPYDIDILEQVFKVPAKGETEADFAARPLCAFLLLFSRSRTDEPRADRKANKFWKAKSVAQLVEELEEGEETDELVKKVARVRWLYSSLSATYQSGKGDAGIPLA